MWVCVYGCACVYECAHVCLCECVFVYQGADERPQPMVAFFPVAAVSQHPPPPARWTAGAGELYDHGPGVLTGDS